MKPSTLWSLLPLLSLAEASPFSHKVSSIHNQGHNTPSRYNTSSSTHNSTSTCTNLNQRKAWHVLSESEKSEYIQAVQCLMTSPAKSGIKGAKTRWDELHSCHVEQSNFIHGVGAFPPWHRLYIRLHEKLLQEECGYKGAVPYWDEQRDLELFGTIDKASVWGTNSTSFGTNGRSDDGCVVDGPFANTTLRMDQIYGIDYYDEYCLQRSWNQTAWTFANQSYVDTCFASADYNTANFCYVDSPHSCGHLAVGGTMENQNASPGDPLFFLHHANLDRLFWRWQQANLTTRLTEVTGPIFPPESIMIQNRWLFPSKAYTDYDGNPGNVTTLNHVLWTGGIMPNVTIADVMDLNGELICAEYVG